MPLPAIEAIWIRCPPPRLRMPGSTAIEVMNGAVRLPSTSARIGFGRQLVHVALGQVHAGVVHQDVRPADASLRPWPGPAAICFVVREVAGHDRPRRRRSSPRFPPAARCAGRSARPSRPPARTAMAMARPMPLPAPVTQADFPSRRFIQRTLSVVGSIRCIWSMCAIRRKRLARPTAGVAGSSRAADLGALQLEMHQRLHAHRLDHLGRQHRSARGWSCRSACRRSGARGGCRTAPRLPAWAR